MKKYTLIILLASLLFNACQEKEESFIEDDVLLSAVIDQEEVTKTVKDDENNILWSKGDQIVAFMKSSHGHKYQVKSSFVGKSYADFSRVSSSDNGNQSDDEEFDHIVAYYPYSETVECTKSGDDYVLDVALPSEQKYVANTFDNGAMAMVAVSENRNIVFKNVLGAMELQFTGVDAVKSIKVEGLNGEKLSGSATLTICPTNVDPTISMSQYASTSVTLDCGEGVQLNEDTATSFIIPLPPVVFTKGFKVTVTMQRGKVRSFETTSANTVNRSSILVMPQCDIDMIEYIDEYGINHGNGIRVCGIVWAPVNCGYHATDYQWGKLYQWGRKYGQGYSGYLVDVNGNSVGKISDATTPTLVEGGDVSLAVGNSESKANVFYYGDDDWSSWNYDTLWNDGTEDSPVKTEYDPCPEGWRVPTYSELRALMKNRSSWTTNELDQPGYWFSISRERVFFPAAGSRDYYIGSTIGNLNKRGRFGYYWSSTPYSDLRRYAYYLSFDSNQDLELNYRAYGYSVRCVQE